MFAKEMSAYRACLAAAMYEYDGIRTIGSSGWCQSFNIHLAFEDLTALAVINIPSAHIKIAAVMSTIHFKG